MTRIGELRALNEPIVDSMLDEYFDNPTGRTTEDVLTDIVLALAKHTVMVEDMLLVKRILR